MIRRPPTRLELKMDDISEYENAKALARKNAFSEMTSTSTPGGAEESSSKVMTAAERRKAVQERIGFDPQPKNPS